MSREVDSRVVEMRFDNENFEKNTKKTISSIDKLMEKLQFKGAEKGFEKLDAAAEDVDFATMQTSLDRLESKFSSLNIVATTALVNITNKFVDAGEKLVKSLSIDQVASGWDKYTEKTANIQTIMNATGKSIDQVNGYLNKLMWYSDETSYSFSEMTSALSQMTASGGDIEKMIPMIMGIANATADAGKTGFAFQSTIRNLTQSYSAGYLQLQDWKSLNLMGTATKALKQELIDTAVELGTLKEGEVTIASFESTLSKKWANTKVMEKTFEKYASMMEAAYDLVQKNPGMTSSDALEQLSGQYGELAERAALAAQQATSFSQAIDSTKDAVSSKWMSVFETFFGNKEEATETWTELANRLYDIFVPSIDALNERLKSGLNSGWNQLLENELGDQADAYSYALQQVATATGLVTEEQIQEAGSFSKALQQNGVSADLLKASLDEAQASAEKLLTLSDEEMAAKGYDRGTIQRDAEAFAKLNTEIQNGSISLDEYAQKIGQLSGREHLMQSLWNIMDAIGKVITPIKEAFSEIFPPADGERIYSVAERLDLLTQKLIITDETAAKIKKTFKGVFTVLKGFTTILSKIGSVAKEAFSLLANAAEPVAQVLLSVGAGLGDFLETIYQVVTGSGTLKEKLGGIKTALTKLMSPIEELGGMIKTTKIGQYIDAFLKKGEESTGVLGSLYSVGKRAFTSLSTLLQTVASGGAGILGTLELAISTLLTKLGGFGETIMSVLGLTKPNLEEFQQSLIDMPTNLSKSMSEFASSFQSSMNQINGSVGDAFAPVKQFFTALKEGFDSISGTDIYRLLSLVDVGLLAFTIGQLAKATKSLKTMLETPLTGLLNSVAGTFKQLTSAIKTWQKNESSKTLTSMAASILILASAMYVMSRINPDQFTEIAVTVAGFIALLTVSAKLLEPTTKRFDKAFDSLKSSVLNAATLWGTAAALTGLGIAIGSIAKGLSKIMTVMQNGDIAANVGALAVVTTSIVALMVAMQNLSAALVVGEKVINHKVILSTAVELVALSAAIKVLTTALKPLSEIQLTSLAKAGMAVASLGGLLTTMSAALSVINKVIGPSGFQNGAAITAMASGIWIAAQAVASLANIPLEQLDAAMTSVKTLMLLMTTMSAFSAKTKFGSGAGILVMSTSLIVLAGAVGIFSAMGDAAIDGLKKVAAGLAALTAASRLAGADGAASILTISSAMLVLAGAVAVYTALGDDAWLSFAKVAIGLGEMMAAVALLARMSGEGLQAAWVINTLSGGMIKLAAACAIFNLANWSSLGKAAVAISGLIAILLGAGALNSVFPMLSTGLTVLGTAFNKFASGALKLTGAMAIIGVLSMFAGPICQAIINAAPDIQEALIAVVNVLCNTIVQCAEPIAIALSALGTAAIVAIVKLIANLWEMIQPALDDLWSKFKGWCAKHNPFDPSNWGGTSDKISTNAKTVQKSFWQPFADILDELKNGNSFAAGIYQTFAGIGKNTSEGLKEGQLEGKKNATDASEEVANAVIETSKETFDTNSPSKVMAQIGQYVTLGLAEGIGDESALSRAKMAMLNAASAIKNVFTTFWGIHSPSLLAEELAGNILEGEVNGLTDEQKQEELRQSAYDSAIVVKDGATAALDEATTAVQNSMVGLYNAMKMDTLHPGNLLYQNGLKGAQNAAKQAAQDNVMVPTNNGFKKSGNKTPSTWEEIKNAAESTWNKYNPFGALSDYYQNAVSDALDGAGSSGSTSKGKSAASKTGKSLADTLASAYSDQLKANKTEMTNASSEYALWEVTGGDTATVEELISKKTESLTKEIDLQTERVKIAQEQYDTMLSKVGADNSKTKDAYSTLLSEQKTLAELHRDKQDSILKVIKERYETDTKTAEDEYELWSALYEDSAAVTEKSNKKIEYINRKITAQAEILLATEKDYTAIKEEFGEASQKTQAAYQQYLEAQTDQQELINELNKAQIEAYDNQVSYLEKQEKLITNRQNMLAKMYGDGDLSGREDAYKTAVEKYGADSAEARKAATQGTMTAIIGVGTALDSMSYSLKKVTNKQLKYDEAVKKFGKNSETALDALADLQSEQYNFVGFAENLADAFEMDDSGKRMMMQLGYSISKNWQPIKEGFASVWKQVEKTTPELATKLTRAFGTATKDGVTEVFTDLFGTITAIVSGDWGGAITGGITTILDVLGTEFGRLMMSKGMNALMGLPKAFSDLAQGGGTVKILGQVVQVTGATENLTSIFGNLSSLLGSATGGTGLLGEALGGLGSIGEMLGSGGLLGSLGELGRSLMSVLGSIGPEGWLIAAAVAGGGLLIANWDKVTDFFANFFDWLGNAFSSLWNWISEGFQGLVDVGANLVSGLWNGITGAAGAIWDGITSFGGAIVDGFCSFFGIHSPSRVMAGIGEYLTLGLAQGITNESDSVMQGVQDVSDTALTTMMSLAQRVGDIASDDFEYEPSIQPVVDMSDVQNGVDWLNDTLYQNGTVALNADRTAGLAANVVRKAELAKAQKEEANKPDENANSNADIVESVEALGEHIDRIAQAVSGMKVQMNGRKLVGEIINDVDEGLGKISGRRK